MKYIIEAKPMMAMGFGMISKFVMLNKELTIEARAIYAYLCSYTGAGEVAIPSDSVICDHLGISEEVFYKHRKMLEDRGYIRLVD